MKLIKNIKQNLVGEIVVGYKTMPQIQDLPKIGSSKDAATYIQSAWDDDINRIESFLVIPLNRRNKVLGWAKISIGGISSTVVDVRVIAQILINSNASGCILAHNHPSGDITPSKQDKDITQKIKSGLNFLDIQLLDHIIITPEQNYYSFADNGEI